MSIEALKWALNDAPCSSPTQKLVLLALANHARPDGTSAFPSVATIARYTLLSERAIRTHLDTLEVDGLIARCDEEIVAAYIRRADRRPQGWNLCLHRVNGVREVQVAEVDGVQEVPLRGAGDSERGAPRSERGAGGAPEPYITVHEPYIEPTRRSPDAARLCELLADLMVDNGVRRPNITQGWVSDMDRMMRLDGRTAAEVEAAIRWSQRHPFWRANILSPRKLREKYDTMRLQAERDRRNTPRGMDGIAEFLEDAHGQV